MLVTGLSSNRALAFARNNFSHLQYSCYSGNPDTGNFVQYLMDLSLSFLLTSSSTFFFYFSVSYPSYCSLRISFILTRTLECSSTNAAVETEYILSPNYLPQSGRHCCCTVTGNTVCSTQSSPVTGSTVFITKRL